MNQSTIKSQRQFEQSNPKTPSSHVLDLSVVIVSWNTCGLLAGCLASVYATLVTGGEHRLGTGAPLTFEVIVVDNGSTDGSVGMVRERFPQVHLITSQENLGFARANNLALRNYRGRYVVLLNPDTEVQAGAFEALVSFMDQHLEAGAAGPLVLNPDRSLQQSCYLSPGLRRELWRLFHGDVIHHFGNYLMEGWSRDEIRPVDVIQGACLILRREVLDRVGILDEDFYIYSEEVDLCERIRRNGWEIYWVPRASVIHFGGQSTRQAPEAMFLQLYRSKILYFRKHKGKVSALAYKLILYLASITRLVFTPLADLKSPVERHAHYVLARNYYRLIHELPRM